MDAMDADLRKEILLIVGWLSEGEALSKADALPSLSDFVSRIVSSKDVTEIQRSVVAITIARALENKQK